MTKIKTSNIHLDLGKVVDKKILDYFDQSLILKTALVKTALIHEIEHLKALGDPYVKDNSKTLETPENKSESSVSFKERLRGGFSAFSDKDIQVTGFSRKPTEYTEPNGVAGRRTLYWIKINLIAE